ncbi:enzyme inhibitor, putative [Ricinus communis]|uniref:Pectinesterase n=1 Tax=Ricinus communis TaxID=3988 RepID=B9RCQ5_RICCO|nr:enzyme inhibitor, putative [Ricinus communis]
MDFSFPSLLLLSPITTVLVSTSAVKNTPSISLDTHLSSLRNFCNNPDACFDSLKLSISINIDATYLLHSLQTAISTNLFVSAGGSNNVIEKQRGTIQECQQLHQITSSSLQRISVPRIQAGDSRKQADARTYLSAALTNKNTCLDGLYSASGPLKTVLVDPLTSTYMHVSNSLSMLPKPVPRKGHKNRRLLGFPTWISKKDRRILQSDDDQYDPSQVLNVAVDGSGNFSTITDAINFAPSNSENRIIIYVKQGVYVENVEIPMNKPNIVLIEDGSDVTFITGSRSVGDGWTTFRSATLAVAGDGFLARDMTVENRAGPEKRQAVALRRECDVAGTVDYIFGNAAVIFQGCNLISRMPMPGQFTVITAQSRETSDQNTRISIQNCSVVAEDVSYSVSTSAKSYLGRPWTEYSRTVILGCFIDGFIDPAG